MSRLKYKIWNNLMFNVVSNNLTISGIKKNIIPVKINIWNPLKLLTIFCSNISLYFCSLPPHPTKFFFIK